jgi:hypothetical protein
MTLARNDSYPQKFANGGMANIRFEILVGRGSVIVCHGGYLITDSGYLKQNCFVCPMSNRVDRQAVIFSEFLESSRKDVECAFGQLKQRFRMLKKPLEMDDLFEIDLLFKACFVLHNMILVYDHRDIEHWEVGVDWEVLDPDADEPEDILDADYLVDEDLPDAIAHPKLPQFVVVPGPHTYFDPKRDHQQLLNKLCKSFQYQYEMNLISWPRSFSMHQKRLMPCNRVRGIANRAERDMYDTLIVKASSYLGLDEKGTYTVKLNNGLFAGINYKKKQRIVKFKDGERISIKELERREDLGLGGYALDISQVEAMDLYSIRDSCKASMVNDPKNAWNPETQTFAKANCVLRRRITATQCYFYLEATDNIVVGEEFFYNYSSRGSSGTYRFPKPTEEYI